ncbi:MAG: MgtC/SapB family protein [Methanomassiliicoccales archaeon]|nr:MgtC/SapB family protein [Methanomassiliicoccales archaeon]
MSTSIEFIYYLLIAIAVGALVGVEREHHKGDDMVIAGIRTFPLVSVLGFLLAYIGLNAEEVAPGVSAQYLQVLSLVGIAIVAALAVGLLYIRFSMGVPGLTTPFALVITYVAGLLVGFGLIIEAVVVAVVVTFLLVSKKRLHAYAELLDDDELIGALEFIAIAFIAYPVTLQLDLQAPYDVFNPGEPLAISNLFLIVVFVSSISFISFLLIRWQGPSRGLRFSGLLGGLVSSEATTISLSNLAKRNKGIIRTAASGILLANATMFARDLAVTIFADMSLATATLVALPLLALSGVGIALGYSMKVEKQADGHELDVRSPFAIVPALKFGIIFLIITAVVYLVNTYLGQEYIYFVALGGMVSSAAVAASVSSYVFLGELGAMEAAQIILLATAISSFTKLAYARYISKDVFNRILPGCLIMGGLSLAFALLLFAL